ncbi:hypothetical protein NL676_030462 [Syzygium grande]|nr:hypothetical protein NL676_030462 [Syzygium grande]
MNGEQDKVGDHDVKASSTPNLLNAFFFMNSQENYRTPQVISTLARTAGFYNFLLMWPHSSRSSLMGMGIKETA